MDLNTDYGSVFDAKTNILSIKPINCHRAEDTPQVPTDTQVPTEKVPMIKLPDKKLLFENLHWQS
ncbi:Hypothetical predicted protein, partial [Marmota monax]